MAHLRVQCEFRGQAWNKRARGAGLGADGEQSSNHLRGLESAPPDKNMGLWREVYLTTSGAVALRHPACSQEWIRREQSGAFDGDCASEKCQRPSGSRYGERPDRKHRVAQPVELAAGESKDVVFTPGQYPQLNLSNRDCGGRRRWGLRTCTN